MEPISIITTIFLLLVLLFLASIFFIMIYALIFGGPYAPVAQNRISTMVKLLKLKKGQKVVDLGSGDGRIVIEFAKLGIEAHGYEINPVLVFLSWLKIRKLGLSKIAFIHFKDYWMENLSKFDAVTLYVSPLVTGRIKGKLVRELKSGRLIVSNHFKLPGLKSIKEENKVYLYKVD